MEIKGKVAIVTGAGSGIGKAVARELANRGATVALVDAQGAAAASKEIDQELATTTYHFDGDVRDPGVLARVMEGMTFDGVPPQILVPCAGITRDRLAVKFHREHETYSQYPKADWDDVLAINLTAPVDWALEMVTRVARKKLPGAVVFVGSISSRGNVGQVAYAATKAALRGVAATLNKEWRRLGVSCGIVHPGFTRTPMVEKMGQELIDNVVVPNTQIKRLIEPHEVAEVVALQIELTAIHWETWVDGGWHAPA